MTAAGFGAPSSDARRFTLGLVAVLCLALGFLAGVGYALTVIGATQ